MGLFGEKEKCCICQAKDGKKQILDGRVCWDCIHLAGSFLKNKSSLGYKQNSKQDFYEAITKSLENEQKLQEFHETDNFANSNSTSYMEYGDYIKIDDNHKWWYTACGRPSGVIFNFSDVVDFEIYENGRMVSETKTKGGSGVGRAAVGGMLFGPAGAIVGATTKKKKAITVEKELLSNLGVRIILNNKDFPSATIDITKPYEVTIGSILHENLRRDAEEIVARLRRMQISVTDDHTKHEEMVSTADEILKYKQLLELGAITQEEFETKKKQLLRL